MSAPPREEQQGKFDPQKRGEFNEKFPCLFLCFSIDAEQVLESVAWPLKIFDADLILYLHSRAILRSEQVLSDGFCADLWCLDRDYAVISSVVFPFSRLMCTIRIQATSEVFTFTWILFILVY